MHRKEYRELIDQACANLGIKATHFSDNWAIRLSNNGKDEFIVGYTFPLNDSASCKIARNKNLCSEVLDLDYIKNVPHKLLLNPAILIKRQDLKSNWIVIQQFIQKHNFPVLLKRNNTSGGDGVFKVSSWPELEVTLSNINLTDNVVCLSPFRKIQSEYRNIVLDDECILSYEKQIPFVMGNGQSSLLELLIVFCELHGQTKSSILNSVDIDIRKRLDEVIPLNQRVLFNWKHNASPGSIYKIVKDENMAAIAIKAARAINARFVSVDIITTDEYDLEVLEINSSVVLNIFSAISPEYRRIALEIYQKAILKLFKLQSHE